MQNRGRSNIRIERSERGSNEFPGTGKQNAFFVPRKMTRLMPLENEWRARRPDDEEDVNRGGTVMLTIKWKINQKWRDNRSMKKVLTAAKFGQSLVECMFVSHGLYHVNIFSCITVLGALFLCCRLHLELIHHLKYRYVIDRYIYIYRSLYTLYIKPTLKPVLQQNISRCYI